MKLLFIILCFFNFINSFYAQSSPSEKLDLVHMYYDISPKPEVLEITEWVPKITSEMREKWILDNVIMTLSFIVEKNGMLSEPKVSSEKWKPTKDDLIHLNKIINSQGKWTVAKIGPKIVRGKYFLTLQFQ